MYKILQERFISAQDKRRELGKELASIEARLKELHAEMQNTMKGDEKYLHLCTEEHKVYLENILTYQIIITNYSILNRYFAYLLTQRVKRVKVMTNTTILGTYPIRVKKRVFIFLESRQQICYQYYAILITNLLTINNIFFRLNKKL